MASGEPIPPLFELDLARYELRRDGRVERLEKLPMELLILLAERRGQLVTRAEILERLWGRDVSLSTDAAINTAVRKVRRALGDDPDAPRFLETVVGKGYRFVGDITVIPGTEPASPAAEADDAAPGRGSNGRGAGGGGRERAARVTPIEARHCGRCLAGSSPGGARPHPAPTRPVHGLRRGAALREHGRRSRRGLLERRHDRTPSSIAFRGLPHLKVIARASVFRYKGQHPDLAKVARDLGVRAVVTGRVSPRPDGFAVAVELMDAQENKQLWGATFDRRASDLVAAHQEVAAEVAQKLRVELTPG
jgi:DNA-binding winged helix-turn-helix (wHTH) protein